jgi:magnesium-transporting ATPase (P-type)
MCAVKFAYIGNDVHDLKVHDIVEDSYNPETEIKQFSSDIYSKSVVMKDIATICALNNKAGVRYENGLYSKLGEPTEAALKVFAEKLGRYDAKLGKVDYTKEPEAYSKFLGQTIKKVAALDFTSERKLMSTVVTGFVEKGNSTLIKGAPERVIEKCTSYKNAHGNVSNFTQEEKRHLIERVQKFSSEGLRILGVAAIYDAGRLAGLTE